MAGRTVGTATAGITTFAAIAEATETGLAGPVHIVRTATHAVANLKDHIEEATEAITRLTAGRHALAAQIDAGLRTLATSMQDATRTRAQLAPAFGNAFLRRLTAFAPLATFARLR